MQIYNIDKYENLALLIDLIIFSKRGTVTYNELAMDSEFSITEIRSIVKILKDFNVVYTVQRIGIFVNEEFLNELDLKRIKFDITRNLIKFDSDKVNINILRIDEFEALPFIKRNSIRPIVKFLCIIIYLDNRYSLYYKSHYKLIDGTIHYQKFGRIHKRTTFDCENIVQLSFKSTYIRLRG